MDLFRIEVDAKTGAVKEIIQYAYKKDGHVLVLDYLEEPPVGYSRFIPDEHSEAP